MNKIERVLCLLRELYNGPMSAIDIIKKLPDAYENTESSERKLRHDITALRKAGIAIETSSQGYRLAEDFFKVTEYLDDKKAAALMFVRTLLTGDFPFQELNLLFTHMFEHLVIDDTDDAWFGDVFTVATQPVADYSTTSQVLLRLFGMIRDQSQAYFAYHQPDYKSSSEHRVEPLILEYRDQHFYLVAYSYMSKGEDVTTFRLDRIDYSSLRCLDIPITNPNRPLYPFYFRYYVAAKLVRRGLSTRFYKQRVYREFPDGSVEVEAYARSSFFALRDLLKYTDLVYVTYPPTFVVSMRQTVQSMLNRYV